MASGVTNAQVISANIQVRQNSSTNGAYSFINNSATSSATLSFTNSTFTLTNANGRPTTLTLDGSNTGDNTISSNITNAAGGQAVNIINKNGTGTWILTGSNTFTGTGATSAANGIRINGGVLVAGNNAALGTNGTANTNQVSVNDTGTLRISNGITLDNGLSLNLNHGGTIQSSGTSATNGRINIGTAATTSVTLSTVGSSDVFTVGNGTNDLTGGAADSIINISGPGTVFQNVASNYAGGWSINNGTLRLGSATALGNTGTAVRFGASSTGTLQLNGNSVTIGSLASDVSVGTPVIENGVAGTATLSVSGSSSTTFAGVLQNGAAGTLALSKSGTGTLTLTGANTYSGATSVSAGLLKLNNSSGSATGASTITVNGTGILGGSGTSTGLVNLQSGGTIAPGNSVGDLTLGSLNASSGSIFNFEFNGSANDRLFITDTNGLTLNGGGFNIYTEGGTSGYSTTGTYNIINYVGSIGGTGVGALTTLNPVAGYNYTYGTSGGWVTLDIAAAGVISNWAVDSDGSWNTSGNWSSAVPNAAGDSANFTSAISTSRTVSLDGNKTVGGVSFDNSQGYVIAQGSGGSLILDGDGSQASLITTSGSHTISAPVVLDSTTVSAVNGGASLTVSGSISGAGSLTKSGAGTMNVTGTNSYSGGTTVSGGSLEFSSGSLGSGAITLNGGTLVHGSGNASDISGVTVSVGILGGTINTNGNSPTYAAGIGGGGSGNLSKSGSGTLTLGGNNTYTGTTTVVQGSLVLSGSNASTGGTFLNGASTLLGVGSDAALGAVPGSATSNLTFNPGSGNSATLRADATFSTHANRLISLTSGNAIINTNGNNLTIGGALTGPGNLQKSGAGNLILGSTASAATGTLTVNEGTIIAANQGHLPTGAITLNNSGAIAFNTNGSQSLTNLTINGTNSVSTSSTNAVFGVGTLVGGSGTLTVNHGFVGDFSGSWSGFTGTVALSGGTYRFNGTGGSSAVAFDMGTGNASASVRNGATSIALGSLSGGSNTTLTGSGGGATQAVTYSVGGNNASTSFDGIITNGANTTALTKVGTGTLTLNGTSTFTGATTISAGTLLVNGALGTSAVTVNGGTLGGTGTIGGAVTVNTGAKLAPGASIESLSVAAATLNGGSLVVEYDGAAGGTIDLLNVSGALDITTAIVDFDMLGSALDDPFYIFATYGTLTGSAFASVLDLPSGYNIDYAFNDGITSSNIALVAIPEPGAAL
ncbi:MAG: autotransporter-associated beta strand repeat-containing protein, partial [Akkermansiaceae bacterium]|nr:autotransporter-associated beta strand repeat-containing protein [Akkermansiaceae bacterium]